MLGRWLHAQAALRARVSRAALLRSAVHAASPAQRTALLLAKRLGSQDFARCARDAALSRSGWHTVLRRAERLVDVRAAFEALKKQHGESVQDYELFLERLCRTGRIGAAFSGLGEMLSSGLAPHTKTYNILLRGCAANGDVGTAIRVFNAMAKEGIPRDMYTYQALMDADPSRALQLYDELVATGIHVDAQVTARALDKCRLFQYAKRAQDIAENALARVRTRSGKLLIQEKLVTALAGAGDVDGSFRAAKELSALAPAPAVLAHTISDAMISCVVAKRDGVAADMYRDILKRRDQRLAHHPKVLGALAALAAARGNFDALKVIIASARGESSEHPDSLLSLASPASSAVGFGRDGSDVPCSTSSSDAPGVSPACGETDSAIVGCVPDEPQHTYADHHMPTSALENVAGGALRGAAVSDAGVAVARRVSALVLHSFPAATTVPALRRRLLEVYRATSDVAAARALVFDRRAVIDAAEIGIYCATLLDAARKQPSHHGAASGPAPRERMRTIAAEMERVATAAAHAGVLPTSMTAAAAIEATAEADGVDAAADIFRRFEALGAPSDVFAYNALVRVCCKRGDASAALRVIERMTCAGVLPASSTYTPILHCYARRGDVHGIDAALEQAQAHGVLAETAGAAARAEALCHRGETAEARQLLRELHIAPDTAIRSCIRALCRSGYATEAYQLAHLPNAARRSPQTSAALVRGLLYCGRRAEALQVFANDFRNQRDAPAPLVADVVRGLVAPNAGSRIQSRSSVRSFLPHAEKLAAAAPSSRARLYLIMGNGYAGSLRRALELLRTAPHGADAGMLAVTFRYVVAHRDFQHLKGADQLVRTLLRTAQDRGALSASLLANGLRYCRAAQASDTAAELLEAAPRAADALEALSRALALPSDVFSRTSARADSYVEKLVGNAFGPSDALASAVRRVLNESRRRRE